MLGNETTILIIASALSQELDSSVYSALEGEQNRRVFYVTSRPRTLALRQYNFIG